MKPDIDESTIESLIGPPDANGCRFWCRDAAPKNLKSRPTVKVHGVFVQVSRYMLSKKIGRRLTSREWALHACDCPPCCNPDHLFVGSPRDNVLDMVRKGRHGNSKGGILNPESIDSIRYDDGHPMDIARKFRIGETTVRKIKCVASWDHVPLRRSATPPYDVLLPVGYYGTCDVDLRRTPAWKLVPPPSLGVIMPPREPGAPLTDADINYIRYDPRKVTEIAASYGVSRYVISKIRSLQLWDHVPLLRYSRDRPIEPFGWCGRIPKHLR